MPLTTVLFCSQQAAQERAPWEGWTIISITGPASNPAKLKLGWEKVLRLEFDDIDLPEDPYQMFTEQHAIDIIDFAAACNKYGVEGILVHCYAGVSRSAAIAKWIAETYGLPFPDKYMLYNKHIYRVLREQHALYAGD